MWARCRTVFLLLPLFFLGNGCRNRQAELIEGELRAREIQYREALDELKKLEHHNEALQREMQAVRHGSPPSPEQASHTFSLKRITLGRSTGGLDADRIPGDEALQVVLEPRDGDDHVIKVPGQVQVTALEITSQGNKNLLCCWEVGPEDLRKAWKPGLFSTGYFLVLPWKAWPTHEQLRVAVKMILSDGRVYEVDKDVRVRLLPGAGPPRITPSRDLPSPAAFPTGPELPLPRKVEEVTANRPPPRAADGLGNAVTPTGQWQVAPLRDAVQLGRPLPLTPPPE